jgi:hypothetical protein
MIFYVIRQLAQKVAGHAPSLSSEARNILKQSVKTPRNFPVITRLRTNGVTLAGA